MMKESMDTWLQRSGKLLACALLLSLFVLVPRNVRAVGFASASVRPARLQTSVNPLPILITAQVSESVSEDHFAITLGSAWSGSASAGAYTVSTAGLPAGVTVWPGIGTADSVAGSQVRFPSADLSPGTTYGFFLTGGITSTPASAGAGGPYVWQLATLVGGVPSSESDVSVSATANDQVVITARVTPTISDVSAELSTTDDVTLLAQGSTITYTITYGSTYHGSTPLTIVADWSLGTLTGSGVPTIDLLEYVAGSAGTAYGGAAPVVDTVNRTITWTIPSFPANTTGETVAFALKTTASYTGSSVVEAQVSARIDEPVTTTASVSDVTYQYVGSSSGGGDSGGSGGSSSSGSSGSSSSSSGSGASETQAGSSSLNFTSIRITQLSDAQATVVVGVSPDAIVSMEYGTSPTLLSTTLTSPSTTTRHTLSLSGLRPSTTYFFRLNAVSGELKRQSELFTFTTARAGGNVRASSLSLSSNQLHVFSTVLPSSQTVLLPSSLPYILTVVLENDELVNRAVLRAARTSDEDGMYLSALTQTQPQLWTGSLAPPQPLGVYQLRLEIEGVDGARAVMPLINLSFSPAMVVLDSQTQKPVERARILLKQYDPARRIFSVLLSPEFLLDNPLYTSASGTIEVALPPGRYQAHVDAVGYASQTIEFDTQRDAKLPIIELHRAPTPLLSTLRYHAETVSLKWQRLTAMLQRESASSATIRLITLWTIVITSPLTLLGLLAQSHFSARLLLESIRHRHRMLVHQWQRARSVSGKVVHELKPGVMRPVAHAVVSLLTNHGATKMVLQTQSNGGFALPAQRLRAGDTLVVVAPGFVPETLPVQDEVKLPAITLTSAEESRPLLDSLIGVVKQAAASLLGINIFVSLILGVIFTVVYKTGEAVPFLVLSGINAAIYLQQQLAMRMRFRVPLQT